MFNTFSKIYKWLKIIIMEILYPKLGIINGSIGYIKNVLHRFWMDIKKCYNASTHKCCSEFEQFHRKYIKLQNIKLQGFLKNVIPIIPISRSFQYHHHILESNTSKNSQSLGINCLLPQLFVSHTLKHKDQHLTT
jgi:hypothetical protein